MIRTAKHYAIGLIFLIQSVLLVAAASADDATSAWCRAVRPASSTHAGPVTENGLAVSLSAEQKTYVLGQPIYLTMEVRNLSGRTFYAFISSQIADAYGLLFTVINMSTGVHVQPYASSLPSASGAPGLCSVAPGSSIFQPYQLDANYRIAEPGTYTVQLASGGQSTPPNGVTDLKPSNTITIRIVRSPKSEWAKIGPASLAPAGQVTKDGLAVSISSQQSILKLGQPLSLTVEFRNRSTQTVKAIGYDLGWSIVGPENWLQQRSLGPFAMPAVGQPAMPYPPTPGSSNGGDAIARGRALFLPTQIDMGAPLLGTFRIQLTSGDLIMPHGSLKLNPSNTVTINIVQ